MSDHQKLAPGRKGTALITGGSSGIGYALAYELARMGYDLVLVSNDEPALIQAAATLETSLSIKAHVLFIDLTNQGAAEHVYQWCQERELIIDILVNNAGIYFFGEVVETGIERNTRIMTLHTTALVAMCTLFGKDMKDRSRGHILNISSISAWMPYPGIALYAGSKQFIKHFSRSLRTEMLDYNVNVTCVCPGAVSTQLYNMAPQGHQRALRAGLMTTAEKLAPLVTRKMFQRKALYVPGLINKITLALVTVVPHSLIVLIKRHSGHFPTGKK